MSDAAQAEMARFLEQGFLVLPALLTRAEVDAWHECCEAAMGRDPALVAERDQVAVAGQFATMYHSERLAFLAPLIGHRGAYDRLRDIGFDDLVYWKANLISKPPGGRRLPWHQDGMLWHDPRAYQERPTQIFLMWYLCDTDRSNGCLRVIPGSHRHRPPLHDAGTAHDNDFYDTSDRSSPRMRDDPNEIDLPVRAGDLLVGDARLLHASHANQGPHWRPLLTVWYFPWFDELREDSRAFVRHQHHTRQAPWNAEARECIAHLSPGAPRPDDADTGRTCRIPGPRFVAGGW